MNTCCYIDVNGNPCISVISSGNPIVVYQILAHYKSCSTRCEWEAGGYVLCDFCVPMGYKSGCAWRIEK